MPGTRKLDVGKALAKLRDVDKPAPTSHDEKLRAVEKEIQRLRAARARLERNQRRGPVS